MNVPPDGRHTLRVAADPLSALPVGSTLDVRWLKPGHVPVGNVPQDVTNWDFFDGAVVAVAIADTETFAVWGSGVMAAPGLALTAKHVVDEHATAIGNGSLTAYCIGVRSGGKADLWRVRSISYPEDGSDIAWLGVELSSEIDESWYLTCMPITTRAPREGETLTVIGFRFDDRATSSGLDAINGTPVMSRGRFYVTKGETEAVYYPQRDSVMAAFPAIDIRCGSLGGMSGGAVIDEDGSVVGILSSGLAHEDGQGPSTAAWIIHALMFDVTLVWPPGLYPPDTPVLKMPAELLRIAGRDKVRLTGSQQMTYEIWF